MTMEEGWQKFSQSPSADRIPLPPRWSVLGLDFFFFFLLFGLLCFYKANWMGPTFILESNLLYSKSTDLNVALI